MKRGDHRAGYRPLVMTGFAQRPLVMTGFAQRPLVMAGFAQRPLVMAGFDDHLHRDSFDCNH